jgi:type I restriction enzyme M protein
VAVKKSELYSSIWKSCDELRGSMDASQYKDYVLSLLFVKYVSDRYSGPSSLLDVPKGGSFSDLVKLKGDPEIGDKVNKVIAKLAKANGLEDVIISKDADFNNPAKLGSGKEMVDRLSNLIAIFDDPRLNFSNNVAEGDDLLGDAYEYLMRHFATESGKSKGQFYTPSEVSRIMAKAIGVGHATSAKQTIYDPACGSGSLLLKAHAEAKANSGFDLAVYGQEMDNATAALSRMNMILHNCPTAEIAPNYSTLSNPAFKDEKNTSAIKTFDFVVANPPFSTKTWANGFDPLNDTYKRFEYGIPPKKNGDYAFLLHILASLKSTGKGAVILPHGVLFRGGSEGAIRKEIISRGFIKAIVGLPSNLFYGTGIPAAIIILDKEGASERTGIFMVDASKGFTKDGPKNRLRDRDIHKIVDALTQGSEIKGFSRFVPLSTITDPKNDYNLNLPRYVDSNDPQDIQDLSAHLFGGIPNHDIDALDSYWKVMPSLRESLFEPYNRKGYSKLAVTSDSVLETIYSDSQYKKFIEKVSKNFQSWLGEFSLEFGALSKGAKPKLVIEKVAEQLLETSSTLALLDSYAIYQVLMSYWNSTLQDDAFLIASVGWLEAAQLHIVVDAADGVDATAGKAKFRSDLLPSYVLIDHYFPTQRESLAEAVSESTSLQAELDALVEEQGGDDGLINEALSDAGNVSKKQLSTRIKEVSGDPDFADELKVLQHCLQLVEKLEIAKKQIKTNQAVMNDNLINKYKELNEVEVKKLALIKWESSLTETVELHRSRIALDLSDRISILEERYDDVLSVIEDRVKELGSAVAHHLKTVGAAKQGMMQQLLTGRTRLPGFTEPWEMTSLKKLGTFYGGLSGKSKEHFGGGNSKYIPFVNVIGNLCVDENALERVQVAENEYQNAVRFGDLLFNGSSETPEEVGLCSVVNFDPHKLYLNSFCFGFRPFSIDELDGIFLAYLFRSSIGRQIMVGLAQGSTRYNLSKPKFLAAEFLAPSKKEQQAIAQVLSDMDAEIEALKVRTLKASMIKTGMMQELFPDRNGF